MSASGPKPTLVRRTSMSVIRSEADVPSRAVRSACDPQQTLLPRRTGILPFRFRLPLNGQLLRFGDLCRGHLLRDAISIADRILVTSRSRQTEPHVCLNIVLRHA